MVENEELVPIYVTKEAAKEIGRLMEVISSDSSIESAILCAVSILRYAIEYDNAGSTADLCINGIPSVRIRSNGIELFQYKDAKKNTMH